MSDSAASEWSDDLTSSLRDEIDRNGWTAIVVEDTTGSVSWAYSIGLFHSFSHPEVIICGLDVGDMNLILNNIAAQVRVGDVFESGVEYSGLLVNTDGMFLLADSRYYPGYLGRAVDYYGETSFPALQFIWPTAHGAYPWDNPELLADQPLLLRHAATAEVPGEAITFAEETSSQESSFGEQNTRRLDRSTNRVQGAQTQRFNVADLPLPERPCMRCGQPLIKVLWGDSTRQPIERNIVRILPAQPAWEVLLFGPARAATPVFALACKNCGQVEFFAPDIKAWLESQS